MPGKRDRFRKDVIKIHSLMKCFLPRPECVILAAFLVLTSIGFAQAQVRVYVTSIGAKAGFTDPDKGNRDTVADLQDALKKKKGLTVVATPEAEIVLTVLGRETAQITAGLLGDPARDRIIKVRFAAAGTETELTASAQGGTLGSGGSWGRAAGKIASQVDDWVKANAAKLKP